MKKGVEALFMMVVTAVALVHDTAAVTCNPLEIAIPCSGAVQLGKDPSPTCCAKLKEQLPCYCHYIRDPLFKPYVDSPKILAACGIQPPTC